MKITSAELREKYQRFFESRGHVRIGGAPLVPENDPTTLFVGSGMQPLLPYLLGETHPQGQRLVNSQRCFRAEDIEEVGDNRHTTYFEMLGNWSLGDYFKEEQLSWLFAWLTKELQLDPERLYVTAFEGDPDTGIERDEESVEIWQRLFAQIGVTADIGERIFFYGADKNWWSRSGVPERMPAGEPGGPDSEVFFDFGTDHDTSFGKVCHPNCDCGRFIEIGNSVFMEYVKQADSGFAKLPARNVDFGGGLERQVAAANDESDIFRIDTLQPLVAELEKLSGRMYGGELTPSFRIIADHLRGAAAMIGAGIKPSNTDQGYVVRRLVRRAIQHADKLEVPAGKVGSVLERIEGVRHEHVRQIVAEEEQKFRETLQRGVREFEKLRGDTISGRDAFRLFASYGLPLDVTVEMAREAGRKVDKAGFEQALLEHQELSREGAEQKFKGGLADHSEMSVKYHTATHLLHQALQDVLGETAVQRGSNITPERLRFDFAHGEKLSADELAAVEQLVNEQIQADLPVRREEMTVEEAKQRGALGLFDERYGEKVSVYTMGDYSTEICGGPHVERTSQLKAFTIVKEESAGSGIRRIRAKLA